jgi:predicted DNA-binding transcriptional regulator AlpA
MNANDNCGKSVVQRTYNASQVAEILGVSLRTAYNLCETTKDFKVIRMGKRCLRIHKESFDRWFDSEYGAPP